MCRHLASGISVRPLIHATLSHPNHADAIHTELVSAVEAQLNSSALTGTMMQLLSEAADQENKEAVLAYTVQAMESEGTAVNTENVRNKCNELLKMMNPSGEVNFDAMDALSELTSAGLMRMDNLGDIHVRSILAANDCAYACYACTQRALTPFSDAQQCSRYLASM
jgi:hypothetical protein